MVALAASLGEPQPVLDRDGLGERFVAGDPATGQLVQFLRLPAAMTSVPAFEFALRQRAARLSDFSHPAYLRVCRVDHAATGLVVVSEHVEGVRLSELLHGRGAWKAQLDVSTALAVVRQILTAVADLHEYAPDIATGLIAPERILVTPRAGVMLAEQALSAAIEQLHYGWERLWRELRIGAEPALNPVRFTRRTDVMNIGLVALALVLGRPLSNQEFPSDLATLLDTARERSTLGYERPLSSPLRNWLTRALLLDERSSFADAVEARVAFERVVAADPLYLSSPLVLEILHDSCASVLSATPELNECPSGYALQGMEPATQMAYPDGASTALPPSVAPQFLQDQAICVEMLPPSPVSSDAEGWIAPSEAIDLTAAADTRTALSAGAAASQVSHTEVPSAGEGRTGVRLRVRSWTWRNVAAAAAVAGLLVGGVALTRTLTASVAAASETGTLIVQTKPTGAQVLVDGTELGRSPVRLPLAAGRHVLEVRSGAASRHISFTVSEGAEFSQYLEFRNTLEPAAESVRATAGADGPIERTSTPLAVNALKRSTESSPRLTSAVSLPVAKPAWGWLSVKSASSSLGVRIDGKPLGSSETGRIRMAAGEHEIELVDDAHAFRTLRVVSISPAKVTTLSVQIPAPGLVNVNASPWAEVWIGRQRIGETPLANVPVPAGRHEVVFRHPRFGEKRQSITVTAGTPVRVAVSMR